MFFNSRIKITGLAVFIAIMAVGTFAYASHSWGGYHWARTANPFTLKLGDNVSSIWDPYLATTSSDWSKSIVLDTTVVPGSTKPQSCKPKSGQVEVCASKYGSTGWLGIASIWVSGSHILQGTVKVNDSYFNTSTYNTSAWRNLVMCQEVGHTLGLDHQDVDFSNPNLGTCMDYTNNPSGPPSNEHPNAHDYEELELIYAHFDSITTVSQAISSWSGQNIQDSDDLGSIVRKDSSGHPALYERDLGKGEKLFTFILWAE